MVTGELARLSHSSFTVARVLCCHRLMGSVYNEVQQQIASLQYDSVFPLATEQNLLPNFPVRSSVPWNPTFQQYSLGSRVNSIRFFRIDFNANDRK